jgi:hypothetical protein
MSRIASHFTLALLLSMTVMLIGCDGGGGGNNSRNLDGASPEPEPSPANTVEIVVSLDARQVIAGSASGGSAAAVLTLDLDSGARMNTPAVPDGNWAWQVLDAQLDPALAARLRQMAEETDRV